METFERMCLHEYYIYEGDGDISLIIKPGKKYLTSGVRDDMVTVFSRVWCQVPEYIFGEGKRYT